MNTIDSAIQSVLDAKEQAVRTQIAFALKARQLRVQRFQGEVVNELLESASPFGKSLHTGRRFDRFA